MAIQDGASPRRPSTSAQRWATDTSLGWHAIVTVTCAAAKKRPHYRWPWPGCWRRLHGCTRTRCDPAGRRPKPAAGPRSEWTGERLDLHEHEDRLRATAPLQRLDRRPGADHTATPLDHHGLGFPRPSHGRGTGVTFNPHHRTPTARSRPQRALPAGLASLLARVGNRDGNDRDASVCPRSRSTMRARWALPFPSPTAADS